LQFNRRENGAISLAIAACIADFHEAPRLLEYGGLGN